MTQERTSIRDVSLSRAMADIEHFCSALSDKPSLFRGHQSLKEKLDAPFMRPAFADAMSGGAIMPLPFHLAPLAVVAQGLSLRQVASSFLRSSMRSIFVSLI